MGVGNMVGAAALSARRLGESLAAGARLGGRIAMGRGPVKARAAALLATPGGQRDLFAALRGFAPALAIRKPLIGAYPNSGTVILSRAADVREMLDRESEFEVVYEPKMRKITGAANFFLGMPDGDDYQRDTSAMRLAARRGDVAAIVAPLFAREAARIVAAAPGRIDLPPTLLLHVPALMVQSYFGVDTATIPDLTTWSTAMFWYLFVDLAGDPAIEARALDGAAQCRAALDAAIAKREAGADPGAAPDDVIRRCLALRANGVPGMGGTGIRDNMIGLVIGAIPTIGRASAQALDILLDRPAALAQAQAAAARGDDPALAAIVFEALRFNPVNPVIYRRAARDCTIAEGTLRARKVAKGMMVLASNLSAMFDPAVVDAPSEFRSDRPWDIYMLWGYGLHRCFGDAINRAAIPALLKPLLARPGLRRAAGAAGRIDGGGTPFPQRFTVAWDG